MFTRRCTACEKRQLVSPSQLRGLEATDRGVLVSYRCMCGAEQRLETAGVEQLMPRFAA